MAEKYAGHTQTATKEGGSAVQDVRATDSVRSVENDLRVSLTHPIPGK